MSPGRIRIQAQRPLRWALTLFAPLIVLLSLLVEGQGRARLLEELPHGLAFAVAVLWAVATLTACWARSSNSRLCAGTMATTICVMHGIAAPLIAQSWAAFVAPLWFVMGAAVFEVASRERV